MPIKSDESDKTGIRSKTKIVNNVRGSYKDACIVTCPISFLHNVVAIRNNISIMVATLQADSHKAT